MIDTKLVKILWVILWSNGFGYLQLYICYLQLYDFVLMRDDLFVVCHSFVFVVLWLHSQIASDCWGGKSVIDKRCFVCDIVLVVICGGKILVATYSLYVLWLYDFTVR